MPAWSAIFIDTGVFYGQAFDFKSPQLVALVKSAKALTRPTCFDGMRTLGSDDGTTSG